MLRNWTTIISCLLLAHALGISTLKSPFLPLAKYMKTIEPVLRHVKSTDVLNHIESLVSAQTSLQSIDLATDFVAGKK